MSQIPKFTVREVTFGTGAQGWSVRGRQRDGTVVRKAFSDRLQAMAYRTELESLWLGGVDKLEALRPTRLSPEQLNLAETAFARLGPTRYADLIPAVELWLRQLDEKAKTGSRPLLYLDEAWAQFALWLDSPDCLLRHPTKVNLASYGKLCVGQLGNRVLADITAEHVNEALSKRWPGSPVTRNNARRALSRFFSWCRELPRRWLSENPACGKTIRIARPRAHVPDVFSLAECRRLLVAARRYRQGKFLRYVVLQLFGGLRPGEALRASRINLKDGEIDLAGKETKTWHPRLVKMDPLLVSWIEVATGPAVNPQNSRLHWDELRRKAKLTRWPDDVLRHTAISHHFRRGGSYGLTAEWAGNSEAIIKRHYQGRVTSDESAVFWGWFPDRQVRAGARKVVSQKRPRTSRAETTSLR